MRIHRRGRRTTAQIWREHGRVQIKAIAEGRRLTTRPAAKLIAAAMAALAVGEEEVDLGAELPDL